MNARQRQTLSKIETYAAEAAEARAAVKRAEKRRDEWIVKAVDAGVSSADVARVAGVSKGRVSQLAPVAGGVPPQVHAQKDGAAVSRVNDPDTVPTLPDTPRGVLAGYGSQRRRQPYGRRTVFLDPEGMTLAQVLECVPEGAGETFRLYLTGTRPEDRAAGATGAEAARAWMLGDPGAGWSTDPAGHYLADPDLPIGRFRCADRTRVTIMRAAAWWGETDADAATCERAYVGLGKALDARPAFAGAGLADTPATTGRALWLRTIPEGTTYPVLSDELRELLHATAGQGRAELRADPGGKHADFTVMDGRLMYGALTWGMPVGEPRRWSGASIGAASDREWTSALRGRGRWRITCTVPEGWEHVGMFMAPRPEGGWCYPDAPGQTFTTWADGSEVYAAQTYGWTPTVHEGITWAEGKPLTTWRDELVKVWAQAQASPDPAAKLAARAVRSILLYAVGAFAARAHPGTGSCPAETPEAVPDDALPGSVRQVGDRLVWQTPGKLSEWSAQAAHPEWSATIWARARTRLLTARGVDRQNVGALHLPPERVVAFATDALYLAGGEPGWADDGTPGRFRVKGHRPGGFAWPSTLAELHALRDEAEDHRG